MTTSQDGRRPERPAPRAERREMERRGRDRDAQRGWTPRRWALLGALVVAFAAIGYTLWQNRSAATAERKAWETELAQVQSFPAEPADHVAPGTAVQYLTQPPTSGPHYDSTAPSGMHDRDVDARLLVHNLEHGHIVIYYDKQALSQEALGRLRQLTSQYRGHWDAVLAVPGGDSDAPIVLTAWTKMLRLKEYRPAAVDAFVDAYRGRGPEKPVR